MGTGSALLDPSKDESWLDLPSDQSARTAVDILEAVEDNARLVAENMDPNSAPLLRSRPNIGE